MKMHFWKEVREESRLQMQTLESELGRSVEACHTRIEQLLHKVDEQSKKLSNYENKFQTLTQENSYLHNKVKTLETQLDDAEQYSRMNCLELNGIPEDKNESVFHIV